MSAAPAPYAKHKVQVRGVRRQPKKSVSKLRFGRFFWLPAHLEAKRGRPFEDALEGGEFFSKTREEELKFFSAAVKFLETINLTIY